jgi:hypothetical protein
MIILNRTPKPRDRRVIVQKSEIKCTVSSTQEVLLIQQKDLIFNQNSLIEQISIEKSEKIRWRQLATVRKRNIKILEEENSNLKLALKKKGLECHFKNVVLEVVSINRELSFTESELPSIKDAKKTKADDYVYPSDIENENSEIEQSSDSEIQSNSSAYDFDGVENQSEVKD